MGGGGGGNTSKSNIICLTFAESIRLPEEAMVFTELDYLYSRKAGVILFIAFIHLLLTEFQLTISDSNIESSLFSWLRNGRVVPITRTIRMPPLHFSKWSFSLGFVHLFYYFGIICAI